MLRNIIFLCTLLCAAFADSCFDYDAMKSTFSSALEECKPTDDSKLMQCVNEYHTCVTNKFGFIDEHNGIIHEKVVAFISEYATDKIKDNVESDTAKCKNFQEKEILDAAYVGCIGFTYVPKCPEILGRVAGFWFMIDGTIYKTCAGLG